MLKRFIVITAVLGTLVQTTAAQVTVQPWPTRPVTIVVSYPPGGITDVLARYLADRLSVHLGQPFVVENRPGAAGEIGAMAVVRAAPDGYTLLAGNASLAVAPLLKKDLGYDPVMDLTPIAFQTLTSHFLVVKADFPAKNLQDFIVYAKTHDMFFGSPGIGSFGHLGAESLKLITGIKGTHVPYKGGIAVVTDLLGGQIQFSVDATVLSYLKNGNLRALATFGKERFPLMPEIPTLREQGVDLEVVGWSALFGPAKMPKQVIEKLEVTIAAINKEPDYIARVEGAGAPVLNGGSKELAAQLDQDITKYRAIAKSANITATP
jgi:tripartite-type tricarboxylate transporter receptor subunit TctC